MLIGVIACYCRNLLSLLSLLLLLLLFVNTRTAFSAGNTGHTAAAYKGHSAAAVHGPAVLVSTPGGGRGRCAFRGR